MNKLVFAAAFFLTSFSLASTNPDNTAVNERDRNEHEVTADSQPMNKSDTEVTRLIRRAVVKDESLSVNAHNIKIITIDGRVTLKGPVESVKERNNVVAKAKRVAGAKSVTDELEVLKSE